MYEVYVKKELSLQKYCQTLRVLYIATYFDRQVLFEHRVNNLSISLDIMDGEKGVLNDYSTFGFCRREVISTLEVLATTTAIG